MSEQEKRTEGVRTRARKAAEEDPIYKPRKEPPREERTYGLRPKEEGVSTEFGEEVEIEEEVGVEGVRDLSIVKELDKSGCLTEPLTELVPERVPLEEVEPETESMAEGGGIERMLEFLLKREESREKEAEKREREAEKREKERASEAEKREAARVSELKTMMESVGKMLKEGAKTKEKEEDNRRKAEAQERREREEAREKRREEKEWLASELATLGNYKLSEDLGDFLERFERIMKGGKVPAEEWSDRLLARMNETTRLRVKHRLTGRESFEVVKTEIFKAEEETPEAYGYQLFELTGEKLKGMSGDQIMDTVERVGRGLFKGCRHPDDFHFVLVKALTKQLLPMSGRVYLDNRECKDVGC